MKSDKWYHHKAAARREDLVDALTALREYVENQGAAPVVLTSLNTYQSRQLNQVHTTRVKEWEFGYCVVPLDENQGFYRRTVFAKLHGGILDELTDVERTQMMEAIGAGALDEGSGVTLEIINDTTVAFHQPFAVMFWNEGNPNVVVPSKELLLSAFDPSRNNGDKK